MLSRKQSSYPFTIHCRQGFRNKSLLCWRARVSADQRVGSSIYARVAQPFVCMTDSRYPSRRRNCVGAALRDHRSPCPKSQVVGDMTYFQTRSGRPYLAVVVDFARRMVVGWATSASTATALRRQALRRGAPVGALVVIYGSWRQARERGVPRHSRSAADAPGYDPKGRLMGLRIGPELICGVSRPAPRAHRAAFVSRSQRGPRGVHQGLVK